MERQSHDLAPSIGVSGAMELGRLPHWGGSRRCSLFSRCLSRSARRRGHFLRQRSSDGPHALGRSFAGICSRAFGLLDVTKWMASTDPISHRQCSDVASAPRHCGVGEPAHSRRNCLPWMGLVGPRYDNGHLDGRHNEVSMARLCCRWRTFGRRISSLGGTGEPTRMDWP